MKIAQTVLMIVLFSAGDLLAQSQSSPGEKTTVILVRHAEKADDSRDPDLSPDGYERADLLAKMMEEIKFDAVYSTSFIRTTETARTVAERNQLEIIEYDSEDPQAVAAYWVEKHRGESILVAGHSNTVPLFVNELLKREHFTELFDESDYGNILMVTITSDDERHILHIRF